MPTIKLKPNSPDYDDAQNRAPQGRRCAMPGCQQAADHRAPKDRSLNEYHWFCFEHVQDYNRAWNYFSGMQPDEVEAHVINSFYWDRPTWKQNNYRAMGDEIRRRAFSFYHADPLATPDDDARFETLPRPEREALAALGFTTHVTFDAIKTRYKELAKKYHPDLNANDPLAEEQLKKINMAYTYLKVVHRKVE